MALSNANVGLYRAAPIGMLMLAALLAVPHAAQATPVPGAAPAPGGSVALTSGIDLKADARLDARVTLSLRQSTVESVLQSAGQQAMVGLKAGRSKDDWLSRELPVSIFVKDVPVRDLMTQMVRLTRFHWSAAGDGADKTYTLWQDLKARDEQAAARDRRASERQRDQIKRGLHNLQQFAALSKATPQELAALADKEPGAYVLGSQPAFKAMTRVLASLNDAQLLQATTKDGLKLPYGQLPPDLQAAVRDYASGMEDLMRRMGESSAPVAQGAPPEPAKPSFEGARVIVRSTPRDQEDMGSLNPMTGEFRIDGASGTHGSMDFPLFDLDSPMGKVFGTYVSRALAGEPRQNIEVYATGEMGKILTGEAGGDAVPVPTDPELLKKVKYDIGNSRPDLGTVLDALHQACGLNLIADNLPAAAFGGPPIGPVLGQEAPLYRVLHRLKGAFGLSYEKTGSSIVLSDDDWAAKRDGLIPQAWLARWKAKSQAADGLNADDLIEMAGLITDAQIRAGLRGDPDLSPLSWALNPQSHAMLRVVATLSTEQRHALEAGAPLAAASLSPDQWSLLNLAWTTQQDGTQNTDTPLGRDCALTLQPEGPPGEAAPPVPLAKRSNLAFRIDNPSAPDGPGSRNSATVSVYLPLHFASPPAKPDGKPAGK